MAFTSTIKPYKFVNPSSISTKGGGATIIAGGRTITGGVTPQVKSARVTMLAINRIGMAMEGLGKTQQQIRDIIVYENKYLVKSSSFRKKRDQYRRDQKSEQQSESFGTKEQDGVKNEVIKKEKKQLGWLEKIFGPFAGIISFVGRVVVTQTVLRWMGDPKNTDKLTTFVKSFTKVFKWAFNIAYKSTDAVLTGFAKVFGSSDKKGLDRFGEVLNGLGTLLIGIAGFKALGYLLNPFSLVNDIIGLVDLFESRRSSAGIEPELPGTKPKPKPTTKPIGFFGKVGNKIGDIRKSLGKGFEKFKGFGDNMTKSMRDKLVKSGEFLKGATQKAMKPIAEKAYKFLQDKGIIKLANNLGKKAVNTIEKLPGYSKILAKVQKEGGSEVLKKLGGKAIPVIGGLVNLYFAYDRLKNGDKSGAALEALSGILDVAGLFTGGATSALSMVLDTYLFGRDFFPDLVKKENEAFGGLLNSILGPINSIKDGLPKIPFLAKGGIVDRPTRAIIGENGPEAIIPLRQLGMAGGVASTLIGATESALSRMGAAGVLAKSLIGGDLSAAANIFGVKPVSGGGGDSLGKSINKGLRKVEEIDAGSDISIYLGKDNIVIRDRKEPGNKPTTLRGQLANVLSALIWVSKKNISSGGTVQTTNGPSGSTDTSGDFSGSANVEKAFNYFKSKGLTPEQAAGLVGNFMQESGVNINPKIANSIGHRGIAQWDPKYRWPQLVEFSRSKNLNPESLEAQLQFVWHELSTGSGGLSLSTLKSAKTVRQAAHLFVKQYERSGEEPGHPGYENRITYGNQVYSKYAKMAKGGRVPSMSFMSRERKHIVEPQLTKAKTLEKYAAGGSHRVIPDTPSTSWAAGIPLTYITTSTGKRAEVALPLAKRFQGFIRELEATGYKITEIGGFRPDGPPPGNIDGKGPQYAHPYGAAIDINWSKNPAFVGKRFGDFPRNSGELAAKYGLGWGSKFDDAMHFSAMKREYGAGIGGKEISGKTLGGSKEGSDYKPEDIAKGSSSINQPAEQPETLESLMSKLKSAVSGLNKSLGYSQIEGEKPDQKLSPPSAKPEVSTKPVATSSSAQPNQLNNTSEQVAKLEEAAKDAGNYGHIIPLPINSGVTQIAYGSGTQVYAPRTPITYGI